MQPNLELAELGIIAYSDPNFFAGNVAARIIIRHGETIIAPLGSNDGKDWCQDLLGFLVPRDGGEYKIFKGFADMGDESTAPFLAYIKSFPAPYKIVAHSAGCAIGVQWAAAMAKIGMKPSEVHLMAAPCTGDAAWASYYNSLEIPTLRIGLANDPVCEAYKDRGGVPECTTLWLTMDGKETVQDAELSGAWREHPCGNYLRSIREYLKAG